VEDEIIPVVLFLGLTIVFGLFFWFRYRMRSDMQQTIRAAIEKGQDLSPEIIDRMGRPAPAKDRDLRWAIIAVAVSVALAIFGAVIPEDSNDAQQVFMGIAAFPFCIGMAYFILNRYTGRD